VLAEQASKHRQTDREWKPGSLLCLLLDSSSHKKLRKEGTGPGNEASWHAERCVHRSYHTISARTKD
jgi:hypothetical protein